jgi:hypothetical protein
VMHEIIKKHKKYKSIFKSWELFYIFAEKYLFTKTK